MRAGCRVFFHELNSLLDKCLVVSGWRCICIVTEWIGRSSKHSNEWFGLMNWGNSLVEEVLDNVYVDVPI